MKKTVAFHTLGCKLNFAETSTIGRLFTQQGYVKTDFSQAADVYVINTCSVTENADRECRSIVRNALNTNPAAFVAVIGCYAQLKPQEIASIEGVDVVLGATEKFRIVDYIRNEKNNVTSVHNCDVAEAGAFVASYSSGDRTRTFLKVQDGCDYSCTFCTIPQARGASRSNTIENVVRNVHEIAATGTREIVLTGVNLGDFGYGEITGERKKREENFLGLVEELDQIKEIERFRISSIEPNLLNDGIISFVAGSQRFMPHFHIPLQSGSNTILKLMKRRYNRELFDEKVQRIKALMPHACIGADVIVGFPGESETDFLETYEFINGLDLSYLHVFTYSERANTPAALMSGSVAIQTRKKRNKMLRILSSKKLAAFYDAFHQKSVRVLFEQENRNGLMHGYSENYIRVKTAFDPALVNKVSEVVIEGHSDDEAMLCSVHQPVLL
jgi:threonylcarbamoyladenosine tRNA methylthiotransferase MtaB